MRVDKKFSLDFKWRFYLAEFLATFLFVFISLGAALSNSIDGQIGILGVSMAAGLAYCAGVFATVHLSGGHLNPAITLAMWFVRKLSSIDTIFYILAQIFAGFAAAGLLVFVFGPVVFDFTLGLTVLGESATLQKAIVTEAVLGALLTFVYFATMVDKRGPVSFGPIAVGFVVLVSILMASSISGGIVNPAKALGPAVVSGAYSELFAWIVGPFVGSLFAIVYDFLFLKGKK